MILRLIVSVLTLQSNWLASGSSCVVGPTMENKYTAHTNIAVATEDVLEFMTSDGIDRWEVPENFNDLTAVTYDPTDGGHIYMTDSKNENWSVFRFDIERNQTVPLVPRQPHSVQGIAYDPSTTALFWTNGHGRTISTMKAGGTPTSAIEPTVLLTFTNREIPTGIALDICKRVLYWTNCNHLSPSIERSSMDGSNHKTIISDNLFQPLGITIDQSTEQLYWSDDREGIYFKIERSDLDGSNRETVVDSTYHQPSSLSIDGINVYWTDRTYKAIWSVPKFEYGAKPKKIRDYRNEVPMGLVTRLSADCTSPKVRKPSKSATSAVETSSVMNDDSSTLAIQSGCNAAVAYCLNDGYYDVLHRECKCSSGFRGMRCEIQASFNYCLRGAYLLDAAGYAYCKCEAGFKGVRCEINVCEGYCLNGGKCHVENEDEPVCLCGNYAGKRCEARSGGQLAQYDEANNSSSSPFVDNANLQRTCANSELQIILVVLGSVIVIMMMMNVFLMRKVCLLRKRPRIKKHIIVNKSVRPTPLTSRPSNQGEQCEITIENCCNMNICETPCFEPQLRTSKTQSKTEEKTNLLGSMEESSSCSPLQEDLY